MDERKGLHDPWRMHSSDREKEPNEKTSQETENIHPLDADLLPQKEYVFRHAQSTGDLLIRGADNATDAAGVLITAIQTLPTFKQALENAGFYFNTDNPYVTGFIIHAKTGILWLPTAGNVAHGLSQLVAVIRHNELRKPLEKVGIIALIK